MKINKPALKNAQMTLEFLFDISHVLPRNISKRKMREFVQLAHKHQIRLGKSKQMFCKKCMCILIPKISCDVKMEKRENGFGVLVRCLECSDENFTVKRIKNDYF